MEFGCSEPEPFCTFDEDADVTGALGAVGDLECGLKPSG
jgi:hypothetical protein